MHIYKMLTQYRRDFTAVLICESCGQTEDLKSGYDDANYHNNVIPNMKCKDCGEKAPVNQPVQATKYPEGMIV